jgi:hypothetical protein
MNRSSSTRSSQAEQTNKQTRLRANTKQKRSLKKRTKWQACCYGRESARTTENGAIVEKDVAIRVFAT